MNELPKERPAETGVIDPKAVCIVRRHRIRARRAAHPGRHPRLAQAVPLWNRGAAAAVGARWRVAA